MQVELFEHRHKLIRSISGGMQRRLSLAISLIGDPKVLLLDEPTTGLDIESRKAVWECIERAKVGHSIILTTHAMEEAAALCSRIGILVGGKLRCIGNQRTLKNRFGKGYKLMVCFLKHESETAKMTINTILPFAKLEAEYPTMMLYAAARDQVVISKIFTDMEAAKQLGKITAWGLNQTSIDDVFFEVVER